jgi:uncharacterized protein YrrD
MQGPKFGGMVSDIILDEQGPFLAFMEAEKEHSGKGTHYVSHLSMRSLQSGVCERESV